ncbi:MAG: hypothetical protein JW768_08810 [Chitinispirillaceae bacterium]|nr:hypothetical protein [Chitinispirillaceae bacterium]
MCRFILLLILVSVWSANAQTINVRGIVTSGDGDPVSGAVVTLLGLDLKDTTGGDGAYAITQTTSVMISYHSATSGRVALTGSLLEFKLFRPSSLTIEVFDIKSNLLKSEKKNALEPGTYHRDFSREQLANQLLIVRASINNKVFIFRYMPLTGKYSGSSDIKSTVSNNSFSATAVAGVADTLEVQAAGYSTKFVAVESYDTSINVTLNPADKWGGLKNPPRRSSGCGKPQGITSGKKTIRSGGRDREYIIDIPPSYDPDMPYRFFYVSHWINGNAQAMADNNYYGLKTVANAADKPAIFVAASGINGSWVEQDHALFDDILAYVGDNLCIDITRVFAIGYSFGGMYTYSLSTNHQDKIRAGVGIAPANYNIWLPKPKLTEPIAWMQITGMSDDLCPWDAGNNRGAKYIALEKATDNGCDIPAGNTIPTWQNGPHICYDFEGCAEGYPVKVCTFDGPHSRAEKAKDPGASSSWVPGEAWKFFSQF